MILCCYRVVARTVVYINHHFTELTMSEGMECVYDLSIVHLLHFLLYHHFA